MHTQLHYIIYELLNVARSHTRSTALQFRCLELVIGGLSGEMLKCQLRVHLRYLCFCFTHFNGVLFAIVFAIA